MVAIVVVNWNSGPLLQHCLASIREQVQGCEVVVIDNASKDTSLDFLPQPDSSLLLQRNETNAGFAAASNQGWRAGRGDPVLFLNPDTECLPGGVAALTQRLAADSGVWAVGGRLLDPSGAPQAGFNVRAFPSIGAVAAELLLLDEIWPLNPWTRRYRMSDWAYDSPRDVDQPAAACLMVRRAVLESMGGFDEAFHPAWFEDVDLCKRIRDAGGRIVFEPEARFMHHGGASLHSLPRESFLRFYHTNQIRYFRKHHGRKAATTVRGLVIAGFCLRALAALAAAQRRARTQGTSSHSYWRLARHFAAIREAGQ